MTRWRALARGPRRLAAAAGGALLEQTVRLAAARARHHPTPRPSSLFVLRNNDVGDLLVITPLFAALRRHLPGSRIVAGVGDWARPVLDHNPSVDEVLEIDAPWYNRRARHAGALRRWTYLAASPQVRRLRRRAFPVGIDVLGSAWGALLLLRAGIPYRLGVRGFAGGHSGAQATVAFDPREHVGRTALRFAELLGCPTAELPPVRPQLFLTPAEQEAAEGWWRAHEHREARSWRVVIAPGGGVAARRWPAERFAALAARVPCLADTTLLVLAGPGEDRLAAEVVAGAGPRASALAGSTGLREAFGLLAAADFVICNSSMPLHAAAAFAKPTLVLLGEGFGSAAQHDAQWGYPWAHSLGRESAGRGLAAVEEAFDELRRAGEAATARRPRPGGGS